MGLASVSPLPWQAGTGSSWPADLDKSFARAADGCAAVGLLDDLGWQSQS